MRLLLQVLFAVTLLGALNSCASTAKGKALEASVKGFNENLRWKRFSGAATFVPSQDRNQFMEHYLSIEKDLFIQSLEITNVFVHTATPKESPEKPLKTAQVLVMAEYYVLPSTVVQRRPVTQEWHFKDGVWQMIKSNFKFGDSSE